MVQEQTEQVPDAGRFLRGRISAAWGFLPLVLLASLAAYSVLAAFLVLQKEQVTPRRAQFFAAAIDEALTRLDHLPYVIAIDPNTLAALRGGDAGALNPTLAAIAGRSGAEFVFVMDVNGLTVASSNFDQPDTLVGNYYTFRPYFRDALAGETGRFYAVGVTTGRPGYFIAEPVRGDDGAIFGVVVVKIGFGELSDALTDSGELVLVADAQDVVLTSSDETLVYGLLSPLSETDRRTLEEQQQFGNKTLFALDWQAGPDRRVRLNGTEYLWTRIRLGREDWTLHLLSDIRDIRLRALLFVAAGLMGFLTLAIAASLFRAAQLRRALSISDADRRRLAREIEERRRAEARLGAAQEELARQGRLAALGQLSASITHELGQPISAMRNYLAAEEIASDKLPGELAPQLSGLVDRMQRIIDQLRFFGRNNAVAGETFVVQEAIASALQLVRHNISAGRVRIETRLPPAPLRARGQAQRFEQVVVNLLRNAIDAVAEVDGPGISVSLKPVGETIRIAVADNGPGIGGLGVDALKEPFFSTKPSGEGMGLGLAISAQIVNEMDGELRAADGAAGGAVFEIELPLAGQGDD